MKKLTLLFAAILLFACEERQPPVTFEKYDETEEIAAQQEHETDRMKFKLIQSRYLDMNEVFAPFEDELAYFSEEDYLNLMPYIYEQDIPAIQNAVRRGVLNYENITLFYLYRIRKFESDHDLYLNGIITLNPEVVAQARAMDRERKEVDTLSIRGLPILLKDNINTVGMPTTAGAFALLENDDTRNAFIVDRILEKGGLILGKVNLSEWAYYFAGGAPLGYSAVGGQTLNPYGRKVFETGGSSSGSGVTIAANYAVAAVGTETSGSILSPSSKNSVVGLKPTIGLLSRTGIVPISSTLDTPGPMTRSVIDNAIFLQAMVGKDPQDAASVEPKVMNYLENLEGGNLDELRLGVLEQLTTDSIYNQTVQMLERAGVSLVRLEAPQVRLQNFRTLLSADMKQDLPAYLSEQADPSVTVGSVADVVDLNLKDSLNRAPYGQSIFESIVIDSTTTDGLRVIRDSLQYAGRQFFKPFFDEEVDAVLSINNYHAGYAAVAKYPCLTVPMGFTYEGEPVSLTFIGQPFEEASLLRMGYAFEQLSKARRAPKAFSQRAVMD